MHTKKIFLTGIFFIGSLFSAPVEEKPMVVIIHSYNNKSYASLVIKTILSQKYTNFRVMYIDDSSSDGTTTTIKNLFPLFTRNKKLSFSHVFFDDSFSDDILDISIEFNKNSFNLISNITQSGKLANLFRCINSSLDEEILIILNGNQWFSNTSVLENLNKRYSSEELWVLYPKNGS